MPAIIVPYRNIAAARTERETLRMNNEFFKGIMSAARIVLWESDANRRFFKRVGNQSEELLGFPSEKWFEPHFWFSRLHPDDRERMAGFVQPDDVDWHEIEYRMIAKDGRVVWIRDVVNLSLEHGQPVLSGLMIDVTERKETEEALRQLSDRLITAQEEERRYLARELHDDLNQRIALISIELEQIVQKIPNRMSEIRARMHLLQQRSEDLSTEIHRMSYQLHPSKLDYLGLASAVSGFCKEMAETRHIKVNFVNDGIPVTLPKNITLCLFRVTQEALQNAAKYSGATEVDVTLSNVDDGIRLIISDAGCGFETTGDKLTKGLGFISMKERLRLVNGELRIISRVSHGTRIEATVPL